MKPLVIHNRKSGNNHLVACLLANHLNCEAATAEDKPIIDDFDTIVFVLPNAGDEELPQPMEDFLCGITTTNKKYHICELGNYFGLESYVGCKKIAFALLDKLGWQRVSDISIDSLPSLDETTLKEWMNTLC